jgi:hypothetical protein
MKGKYNDYLFLLAILIIALLGGFLIQSQKEAFSVKEMYNSTSRTMRQSLEPFKEGMFKYNPFHNFIHRSNK